MRPAPKQALLLALAGASTFGCADAFEPVNVEGIEVTPAADTVFIEDTVQISARVRLDNGKLGGNGIEWRSLGPAIAAVDTVGRVGGRARGTTAIVAEAGGVRGVAHVTVVAHEFVQFAAGRLHTCGITREGRTYCWGVNHRGQLGSPVAAAKCQGLPCGHQPAAVAAELRFTGLAAGADHSCGLAESGEAYCWGTNLRGELGTGTAGGGECLYTDSGPDFTDCHPRPQGVSGGIRFASLTAGSNHTCGLDLDGQAYCWGANTFGQLGDSTSDEEVFSPRPVSGGFRFVEITAGPFHTCALEASGQAYCWGRGAKGQLGTNSHADERWPRPVRGGIRFGTLSAGLEHTCGLDVDGGAWCWGDNGQGQLGTGTAAGSTRPVPVHGGGTFTDIDASQFAHTCAVAVDGSAYCWGDNDRFQLGVAGPRTADRPNRIPAAVRFEAIDGGALHSCAGGRDTFLYCWGYNGVGQVGRSFIRGECPGHASLSCYARPTPVYGGRN